MKSRVLVVDDDPALAEMLTIVLRGEGFDTAVVGDGTRALPAVRDLRPDVVLLDLMLPGMNGIDVCRAIRTESSRDPLSMTMTRRRRPSAAAGMESSSSCRCGALWYVTTMTARSIGRRSVAVSELVPASG